MRSGEVLWSTTESARYSGRKTPWIRMENWECGNIVLQYQEMCFGYYEWFGWESRQVSKRSMDYTGNCQ